MNDRIRLCVLKTCMAHCDGSGERRFPFHLRKPVFVVDEMENIKYFRPPEPSVHVRAVAGTSRTSCYPQANESAGEKVAYALMHASGEWIVGL